MSKMILVAAQQLNAGVGKDAVSFERGTEITASVRKALGLKVADMDDLLANGAIVEEYVRGTETGAAAEPTIVEVSDIEKLTVAELSAVLTVREVPIPADAKKADLVALILA